MKILIADDDVELCALLKEFLEQEDMLLEAVHDGQSAIERLRADHFDLLILDVMMPNKNGFDTLAELRKFSQIPVVMLTAKGDKIDRIVGLEMGADDYLPKPCDPRELVARIRAVTRRTYHTILNNGNSEILTQDNLTLNPNNRQVSIEDNLIELTSTEFDCLQLLLINAGSLVSRDLLSEKALGKKLQSFDRSIDMHISNIRKKLGLKANNQERIKTLRGCGYQYLID